MSTETIIEKETDNVTDGWEDILALGVVASESDSEDRRPGI